MLRLHRKADIRPECGARPRFGEIHLNSLDGSAIYFTRVDEFAPSFPIGIIGSHVKARSMVGVRIFDMPLDQSFQVIESGAWCACGGDEVEGEAMPYEQICVGIKFYQAG